VQANLAKDTWSKRLAGDPRWTRLAKDLGWARLAGDYGWAKLSADCGRESLAGDLGWEKWLQTADGGQTWLKTPVKRRDLDCRGNTDKWGITVSQRGKLKFDPRTATEHNEEKKSKLWGKSSKGSRYNSKS
jgi:hypothetical protein